MHISLRKKCLYSKTISLYCKKKKSIYFLSYCIKWSQLIKVKELNWRIAEKNSMHWLRELGSLLYKYLLAEMSYNLLFRCLGQNMIYGIIEDIEAECLWNCTCRRY